MDECKYCYGAGASVRWLGIENDDECHDCGCTGVLMVCLSISDEFAIAFCRKCLLDWIEKLKKAEAEDGRNAENRS